MTLTRADLLYSLARAFLPPPPGWTIHDWAPPLQDDLAALGNELGLDTAGVCQALDAERRRAGPAAETWLVDYARLFLTPPVAVPLNTGLYLEGAIGGTSAQMMRQCYESAGVEPEASFHDLPDHVAMQLEFLARLYERSARGEPDAAAMAAEFAHLFVSAWSGPLERSSRAAEATQASAAVYTELARFAAAVALDRPVPVRNIPNA